MPEQFFDDTQFIFCPICGIPVKPHPSNIIPHCRDMTDLSHSALLFQLETHVQRESEALNEELEQFIEERCPTHVVLQARDELLERLFTMVEEVFEGRVRMYLFGSCAAGLSSNASDLDICLCPIDENEHGLKGYQRLEVLQQFYCKIVEDNVGEANLILSSRVPICTLTDSTTGIECDFILPVSDLELKAKFMKTFTEVDDRYRSFVLIVKHWAKNRYIGDASKGTLNSFGHTLLAIHFLQVVEPPVLPLVQLRDEQEWAFEEFESENVMTLSELFQAYIDYYGNFFDVSRHIVSVFRSSVELDEAGRASKFHPRQHTSFCIEDPIDLADNVGRNLTMEATNHIIREYQRAWKLLGESSSFEGICVNPATIPDLRSRR